MTDRQMSADWVLAEAAKAERDRIVAWLRGPTVPDHSDEGGCPFDIAARQIEAGEHLK